MQQSVRGHSAATLAGNSSDVKGIHTVMYHLWEYSLGDWLSPRLYSHRWYDRWILPEMPDFHVAFRNLLLAVNLRHGTDGFTSPPKEVVLRIFSSWKIRRLRPRLNPRTWVPKASTLPLDHRRRLSVLLASQECLCSTKLLLSDFHPSDLHHSYCAMYPHYTWAITDNRRYEILCFRRSGILCTVKW